MNPVEITVTGAEEMRRAVIALASAVPGRVANALEAEATNVMTKAKALCPVVTGTLKGSGFVERPVVGGGEISETMGFGGAASKYALSVHENPRSGKTGGVSPSGQRYGRKAYKGKMRIGFSLVGQWKFLEQPFLASVNGLTARLYARLMRPL